MGTFLYTIVCRYYTMNGIIELDLYDVFKRNHIEPTRDSLDDLIYRHVYTGQAVQYVIKMVKRNIVIDKKTSLFYSVHSPYSIMYDCMYDLKDVSNANDKSIYVRLSMTDKEFRKVYGKKL